MIFTSLLPTWRKAILDEMLAALSTRPAGALLTTPQVHLLGSAIVFNESTPIATFTAAESAFSGYTAIALPTLVGPINPNLQSTGLTADVTFIGASPLTTPGTIYGYWIDHNTGAEWVLAENLPTPVPIANPGDFLTLNLILAALYQIPLG